KDNNLRHKNCTQKIYVDKLKRIIVDSKRILRGHLESINDATTIPNNIHQTNIPTTLPLTQHKNTQRNNNLILKLTEDLNITQTLTNISKTLSNLKNIHIIVSTNKRGPNAICILPDTSSPRISLHISNNSWP